VFLTTKVWNSDHGYDATLRAADASLARLGVDAVDLYLIHWPVPSLDLYVETWRALIALREAGKALSIGVSNFNADHLDRIAEETGVVPAVNQIELHPAFQQTELRAYHSANGILTQSWSPLGQGKLIEDSRIARIVEKHGCTAAQAIIAWHLALGLSVIPKSSNPDRIRANLGALDVKLDEEDMEAIAAMDEAGGRVGPDPLTF
jgi:2,5-diketo-D-gluconate reductase A